jgi:hypothetical protein
MLHPPVIFLVQTVVQDTKKSLVCGRKKMLVCTIQPISANTPQAFSTDVGSESTFISGCSQWSAECSGGALRSAPLSSFEYRNMQPCC